MKHPTPAERLAAYRPALPTRGSAIVLRLLIGALVAFKKVKFEYLFDKKRMRGRPVLLVADHAATDSYLYVLHGWRFSQPNVVIGYQNLFVPGLFRIFLKAGIIPKKLYEPDLSTAVSMLRLKKNGASFLLFPEGIQSMDGSTMPVNPATAGLIKHLGTDVVLCKSRGAYLADPRFDHGNRRGPVSFSYSILFEKEELDSLSEDEIYTRLLSRFVYSDFAANEKEKLVYRSKYGNARGLEKILFLCPVCGRKYGIRTEKDRIICSCGNAVRVDETYSLIPEEGSALPFSRIDSWYAREREEVRRETSDPGFLLSWRADIYSLVTDRLSKNDCRRDGEGILTLDPEKLVYEGTRRGENVRLEFDLRRIPSMPFVSGTGNEFFYKGEYFRFVPKAPSPLPVYILMAEEELHNALDPVWRKFSEDVRGKV